MVSTSPDRREETGEVREPGVTSLPLYAWPVHAGFPSPADDYMEGKLDLNSHVVRHRTATFFVRAAGDSMLGAGIHPGDILVVDRSIEPASGNVVIAAIDGEYTLKRLRRRGRETWLMPENDAYEPIRVGEGVDACIWGVVTFAVHEL